jgi:hypothetical protein
MKSTILNALRKVLDLKSGMVIYLLTTIAMSVVMVSSLFLIVPYITRSAFSYTDENYKELPGKVAIYTPERPLLCQKEPLRTTIHLVVDEVPEIIDVHYRILNIRTGRTEKAGRLNDGVPYATPAKASATISFPIDLPPGQYRYEVVAKSSGREPRGFIVNFGVGECYYDAQ